MSWEERGLNDKLYLPGQRRMDAPDGPQGRCRAPVAVRVNGAARRRREGDGIDPARHEHEEPNLFEIAKTFVKDGIAPNTREHTTLVMSVLKKEYPGNHPKREEVEELLTVEFKNQWRSRGRTSRAR
jgi:hypothetical protein